jgi:hypothetical protein
MLLHVMGSEVCIISLEDAVVASPAPCIAERYISPGEKTWHVRGNFGEFLGNFGEALVL